MQSKFTPASAQDADNCPYDLTTDLVSQVKASIESSLYHLRCTEESSDQNYIDCLILHGPLPTLASTMEVWEIMSTYVPDRLRCLGISNTTLAVLKAIWSHASVKPKVVQNKFHDKTGWDLELRRYCHDKGIIYEAFSVLTANPSLVESELVATIAATTQIAPEVVLYGLARELPVYPLNGTTRELRMRSDISGLRRLQAWKMSLANAKQWVLWMATFRDLIGDTNQVAA